MSLNIGSDGTGYHSHTITTPLLKRTFPNTIITFDKSKKYDLVIKSHFVHEEHIEYDCPYITWSGESYIVKHNADNPPLIEINTTTNSTYKNIYFPYILTWCNYTYRPEQTTQKKWCCAYAFSNPVPYREYFFKKVRSLEPTCYSYGRCSPTADSPPVFSNWNNSSMYTKDAMTDFAFIVAMENSTAPGYVTEKIGNAFKAGSVPIYKGHDDTINTFFNPESFINVNNFASLDAAAEHVVNVWADPHKYEKYRSAPIYLNNSLENYRLGFTESRPWEKLFVDTLRDAYPDLS